MPESDGARRGDSTGLCNDETAPEALGPYRFIEKLGQGGMGSVFKARHEHLDRLFAIKLLPADRLNNAGIVGRFRREMKAVGRFSHPNIVQATDAGERDGMHYLVMELVDGVDVSRLAKRHAPLPVADACEIVRQAAVGVAHAHRQGMVHRDIKPANLMLTRTVEGEVQVKLLDLGLALLHESEAGDETDLTGDGHIMGTVEYMAPEQAADSHEVDARADVYSLGVTLYKLLCGRTPFPAERHGSTLKLMMAKSQDAAPSLGTIRGDLPQELVALVDRMVSREVDERIASAAEVASLLAPFAGGHDLGRLLNSAAETAPDTASLSSDPQAFSPTELHDAAPAPVEALRPATGGRSRRRRAALVACGAVAAALLGVVTLYVENGESTIKVEIHDDRVKVTANDGLIRIEGADESDKTIVLKPGQRTLHVTRGDLKFDTTSLTLRRGENVTVSVKVVDGELRALRDGEVIGRKRLPREKVIAANPDRRAAEFALKYQSTRLTLITEDGRNVEIHGPSNDLPAGKFRLENLFLSCNMFENDDEKIRALAGCTSLRSLTLVASNLSTRAYEETIATLTGLEHFTHQARGTINDRGLEQLAKLRRLQRLTLRSDQVTTAGIRHLRSLPHLETLQVSGTQTGEGVVREMSKLTTLRNVAINDVPLTGDDLRRLAALPRLTSLGLGHNQISRPILAAEDVARLAAFQQVESLALTGKLVTDAWLEQVGQLPELGFLNLHNAEIHGEGLRHLAANSCLYAILLHDSAIRGEGLAEIARLKCFNKTLSRLDLQGTGIGDEGIAHLHSWKGPLMGKGMSIRLDGTKVTATGVAALKRALPEYAHIKSDFSDAEIEAAAKLDSDAP